MMARMLDLLWIVVPLVVVVLMAVIFDRLGVRPPVDGLSMRVGRRRR